MNKILSISIMPKHGSAHNTHVKKKKGKKMSSSLIRKLLARLRKLPKVSVRRKNLPRLAVIRKKKRGRKKK